MQAALHDNDAHSLGSRLGLGYETTPHVSTTSPKPEAQAEGMRAALPDNDAHSLGSWLGRGSDATPRGCANVQTLRVLASITPQWLSAVLGQRHQEPVKGQFHASRECRRNGGVINLVRHVHEDRSPRPHLPSDRHRLVNRKVGRVS